MATSALALPPRRRLDPRAALRRAWALDRPLTLVGVLMLATLAATLVGLLVDDRVITGARAWLKPAKFSVSIAIYTFTLVWLLGYVRGRPRLVGLVSWGTAVLLTIEQVIIVGQVVRGTTSHFNGATPLDEALFSVMGAAIAVVWLLNLLTVVLLLRQRLPDPAFAWALRLGALVSFVGMGVAFFMIPDTPAQAAAAEAGDVVVIAGAHAVGVEDGGPGLPVVGWSTEGGDLRAPHFIGLHALQILPLLGWLLLTVAPAWLTPRHRVALVWTAGLAYLGLVALLTWQARRGQSIVDPDARTLGAGGAGLAAAVLAAALVLLHARRTARA